MPLPHTGAVGTLQASVDPEGCELRLFTPAILEKTQPLQLKLSVSSPHAHFDYPALKTGRLCH